MLYLIDKPHADLGLRTARRDTEPTVVLIQDGVFLDPEIDGQVYAVREDIEVRGVTPSDDVDVISYSQLIELIFESEVKTFV